MKNRLAEARYDWGLLVVLIAVEMDKRKWLHLCHGKPPKMVHERVLERCRTDHEELQALLTELIISAGWQN